MRVVLRLGLWALYAAIVAGVIAALVPEHRKLITDVYLLFLGGLVLVILVRATSAGASRSPSAFAGALAGRRRGRRPRLAQLERLEVEVLLALETAFDLHYRLRPLLREIATQRLASSRGIDLDSEPDAAREVLGRELWELVRPDRLPPARRHGAGVDLHRLRGAVDALARI